MTDARHYRAGNLIESPKNWKAVSMTFDWLDKNEQNISIDNLVFVGQEAIDLQQRVLNGLNGGVGITEGEPYKIEFGPQGNPVTIFKGYLDFMDETTFLGCNEASVALKKEQGSDWLNDVADAYSFRYLFDQGAVTSADFVKVPYVINYVPDNMQLIILNISLFMMLKELYEVVASTSEAIAEAINAATPNVGVGVTWDAGDVIWAALKIAIRIAYAITIVIAIKNLIEQILEQLLPKKRFHLGMKITRLFETACAHLNLQFQSDLLYLSHRKDWVIIPSKGHKGGDPPEDENGNQLPELGVPSVDDIHDKFGDLIRWAKTTFKADYRIENGVFRLEREDYWENLSTYIIPDVWTDQKRQIDVFKFNVDEIVSNYAIRWEYDIQDQNTLDDQKGRLFQATLDQITTNDVKYKNIKNLVDISTGMSMGKRKDGLTEVEAFAKVVAQIVDNLTGAFGSGTNYAQTIEDRIGSLLLSSHFLTLPKVVVMDTDKLKVGQRTYLSSQRLWDELHYIDSFVEINGKHNQWWLPGTTKVKMCKEDVEKILQSNYCQTIDGKKARIDKVKWTPYSEVAEIDYRVNDKFTNNLKLIKISS